MHVLVTCKYKRDRIKKQPRKGGDIVFPIISQWGLSVAIETRVLIQSAPKPYAAFPLPQWWYTYNLIKIGQLASEIFKFESEDDGRRRTTTDDGPLVYYKLTLWTFGSGELIIKQNDDFL